MKQALNHVDEDEKEDDQVDKQKDTQTHIRINLFKGWKER